mmetsp:Transcript_15956/g.35927  ORF Transcript_15956/g.35927 Transcript_15956/m.35927 type:complete len:88 (-) Transcript_15956:325-588(-)
MIYRCLLATRPVLKTWVIVLRVLCLKVMKSQRKIAQKATVFLHEVYEQEGRKRIEAQTSAPKKHAVGDFKVNHLVVTTAKQKIDEPV